MRAEDQALLPHKSPSNLVSPWYATFSQMMLMSGRLASSSILRMLSCTARMMASNRSIDARSISWPLLRSMSGSIQAKSQKTTAELNWVTSTRDMWVASTGLPTMCSTAMLRMRYVCGGREWGTHVSRSAPGQPAKGALHCLRLTSAVRPSVCALVCSFKKTTVDLAGSLPCPSSSSAMRSFMNVCLPQPHTSTLTGWPATGRLQARRGEAPVPPGAPGRGAVESVLQTQRPMRHGLT